MSDVGVFEAILSCEGRTPSVDGLDAYKAHAPCHSRAAPDNSLAMNRPSVPSAENVTSFKRSSAYTQPTQELLDVNFNTVVEL